ncbi:metal ABC transporter ATP-binding protein [Chitinivibrio alkaliphilus]|uniref:ABC-type Mn2+/Zn2+ transport system, ATPase component n=1 Tax=Chitinivibrio alkaliphilus ACht1 TaxID=1313304 RepID=U7D7X0_9BACT|nr:metal ABC transporter ATP-binding protein [Chitinivibrio alkaliphilus]ERP32038.1 ABC-type Mn2+/Zn2+ transport system, ATPase component [Chitinivibrio alkaliphilus ACht1]
MSNGPCITTEKISVHFGQNHVLEDVSFTAYPGEVHAIIGPNGGGKTTFVKSLMGQINHAGKITMEWPKKEGVTGYMPQAITIDTTVPLTVLDYIGLCIQKRPAFLGISKRWRTAVKEVIKKLHLTGKEHYQFSELSGGERQRVLFSQALLPRPDLLILDEPMNNVDKMGSSIFSETIYEMRDMGCTIIWIHHDLAEVKEKADRVTCLKKQMMFSGVPKDVMDDEHIFKIFSTH